MVPARARRSNRTATLIVLDAPEFDSLMVRSAWWPDGRARFSVSPDGTVSVPGTRRRRAIAATGALAHLRDRLLELRPEGGRLIVCEHGAWTWNPRKDGPRLVARFFIVGVPSHQCGLTH